MYITEKQLESYRIAYILGMVVAAIIDIILICLLVTAYIRSKENRSILKYIVHKEKRYKIDIDKLKKIDKYIPDMTMSICKKYLENYLKQIENSDYKIVINKIISIEGNMYESETIDFKIVYKDSEKVYYIDIDTLNFLRYDIENNNDTEYFLKIFERKEKTNNE